jgi:eukaryotic-like serine/threonine-protein kinase
VIVLTQYPPAGAKVKEGRKIYVTITALNAPQIKMPALTGLSQRNAESFLKSYGLLMGQITYRDDLAENIVLEQLYQGKKIEANALIPKGSKIDLVIGNGLGNTELDVPDVLGKTLEEAKALIVGSDLQVGLIQYDPESTEAPGTIIRQNPSAGEGNKIRVGDIVDLWIAGPEPPKDGTAIQ